MADLDDSGSAQSDIVEIEQEWAAAIVSNDPQRFAAFTADEWVIVSDAGVTTRERFLSMVSSGQLAHSQMSAAGPYRIRIFGDAATVTVRMVSTVVYLDRTHHADEWTTDVFHRRDGRWSCVLTQVSAVRP